MFCFYEMRNVLLFSFLVFQAVPMYSQEKRMIDDIKKHREGMAVWWAGHNSWIIKSGDLVVATDLYLENDTRIAPAPITWTRSS